MNEQQQAELFSEQIDRILGGEPINGDGDLPLLSLGQQLSQLNFQATPVAQAAFQSQLVGWFGATGSNLPLVGLGLPKLWLIILGGTVAVLGVGLGLVVLSFIWTGALFTPIEESLPGSVATPAPIVSPPIPATATSTKQAASPSSTPTPVSTTPTVPQATSSLGDVIPIVTTSLGDTLPRFTITPAPAGSVTSEATPGRNITGDDNQAGDGDNSNSTPQAGDDNKGHGNDPDGYDDDNPGQSDGVAGGNDQSDTAGGIRPGNLSGGGNSGGANGGGHGGDKGSGNGNNQGHKKGN